ncbi:hypothetical protein VPNG_10028 [Cytospora leucostoma]|uniref:Uncharacterized protein n=1 Tax=Cytospora leucostoma TaxID=1230097 RepID=A0A423VHN3_9PEZI|nr:hypothetical protein VPNG_10028 [Cytospora leucostoma]
MSKAVEDLVMLSSSSPDSKILSIAAGTDAFPYTIVMDPKAETSSQVAPALHLHRTNGIAIAFRNDQLQGKAWDDELERSNKIVEDKMMQMKPLSPIKRQYGNVVVIQPLPESINKRDILCRVRGGKVVSCILSRFRGKPIAIVKFQDSSSANHYVDFCAEEFTKEIWTFPAGTDFIPYSGVTMTSHVRIYNEAPGLGSTWNNADIPAKFYDYPSAATRCLVLRNCPVERVPHIWAGLGLQKSEHLQKQLEDMWVDQPKVDYAGGKATGTLHVWFSDINTAMLVKQRYYGPLEYEADPCAAMPEDTFILGLPNPCTQLVPQQPTAQQGLHGDSEYNIDEGSEDHDAQSSELAPEVVYIHYHSFPFVSLLDLQALSIMERLSQGVLDPMKLLLHSSAPSSEEVTKEEKVENMGLADRLIDALQRHRFGQTVDRHGTKRAGVRPPNNAKVTAPFVTGTYSHGATHTILQQTAAGYSRADYMDSPAPMLRCPPRTCYTHSVGYDGGKYEGPPQASVISCDGPSHTNTPEPQLAGPQSDQSLPSLPLIDNHRYSNAECLAQASYPTATKPWNESYVAARPVPVGTEPGYTFQFPPPPSGDGYGMAEHCASKGRDNNKSWEFFDVKLRDDENTPCREREQSPGTTEPIVSINPDHNTKDKATQAGNTAESDDTVGLSGISLHEQTAEGTVNVSPISQTGPDYSHQNWDGGRRPEDVFWTVSLAEFKAMNDDQWKAFGTSFYRPPAGFNTAKRHVVELE